jgi:hypothetical protein
VGFVERGRVDDVGDAVGCEEVGDEGCVGDGADEGGRRARFDIDADGGIAEFWQGKHQRLAEMTRRAGDQDDGCGHDDGGTVGRTRINDGMGDGQKKARDRSKGSDIDM